MGSRERRNVDCSGEVQQGGVVGPVLLCTPLLPVPQRVREQFERRGVGGVAYSDGISTRMMEIAPNTEEGYALSPTQYVRD